jgi:hypothetical protein
VVIGDSPLPSSLPDRSSRGIIQVRVVSSGVKPVDSLVVA